MRTTLRDIVGLGHNPAPLSDSALIMIDCQNTYRQGTMQLDGVEQALANAKIVLELARKARIPVIHIQHDGGEGSPYDLQTHLGAIADVVAPDDGERIITKSFPNAFVQTSLDAALQSLGIENIILVGFMTHMCVNSTAHGGFNLGYNVTVIANATATRALELSDGTVIDAQQVHQAALAATRDLYAVVLNDIAELPL